MWEMVSCGKCKKCLLVKSHGSHPYHRTWNSGERRHLYGLGGGSGGPGLAARAVEQIAAEVAEQFAAEKKELKKQLAHEKQAWKKMLAAQKSKQKEPPKG